MASKIGQVRQFNKAQLKQELPDIRPGDTVRVYQKIQEKKKERTQAFEGLALAIKHGKGLSSTIVVRKISSGIGVERTFPLHSPNVEKIEIVKRGKVRRAKLYYLRGAKGKRARLKKIDFEQAVPEQNEITPAQPAEKETTKSIKSENIEEI